VVLGGFTESRGGPDGVTVDEVLRERLGGLGVRVLAGAPFGHGAEHRPWVQGAVVTVHGDGRVTHDEGVA
jgi:muramoyltetrapeptide carboxypeptidase